ncbi:MAG: hypothetical protein VW124_21260 [Paracoccaceae bacterium]
MYSFSPKNDFVDRGLVEECDPIDVIMPLYTANSYFEANLKSIYRNIPVNNLFVGDAGADEVALSLLNTFPRVIVFDHKTIKSLGFSLRKLMEAVTTERFFYFHSDVYIPENFYEMTMEEMGESDCLETFQQLHVKFDIETTTKLAKRSYSGAQIFKTSSMQKVACMVDDDYLYRSEDIIFQYLLEEKNFTYKKAKKSFHVHQLMNKMGENARIVTGFSVNIEKTRQEETREDFMYFMSFLKYCDRTKLSPDIVSSVVQCGQRLVSDGTLTPESLARILETNADKTWFNLMNELTEANEPDWWLKRLLKKIINKI